MEKTAEDANKDIEQDFSSNAITDGLEKYSRFHGKTDTSVWCSSQNKRLTNSIRELVYQINPYYITCIYKRIFEACALNNLRTLELDGDEVEPEFRCPSPVKSFCGVGLTRHTTALEPTTLRHVDPLPVSVPVNKSNSCVYGSASEPLNGIRKESAKEFSGWKTCERPHSAICTRYKKLTLEDTQDKNKSQGKLGFYNAVSPRPISNSLRSRPSTKYGLSRERFDDYRSVSTPVSGHKSPIRDSKHFEHFRRSTSYIDQYREEYTYKKLRGFNRPASVDSLFCRCGSPSCSATNIPNWYPVQSHLTQPIGIPCNMTLKSSVQPVRSPACKKRLQVPSYIKQFTQTSVNSPLPDGKKFDVPGTIFPKEGTKLEFFSNPLTVNSYNPTVKQQPIARLVTPYKNRGRQLATPIKNRDATCQGSPETPREKIHNDQSTNGS